MAGNHYYLYKTELVFKEIVVMTKHGNRNRFLGKPYAVSSNDVLKIVEMYYQRLRCFL